MNDKSKRNELLTTLADINQLIERLEGITKASNKTVEEIHQLLKSYELKIDILKISQITDKERRNEILIVLADINDLIDCLERTLQREEATEIINQLLYAYDIKTTILKLRF